jgi:hypothetical protein
MAGKTQLLRHPAGAETAGQADDGVHALQQLKSIPAWRGSALRHGPDFGGILKKAPNSPWLKNPAFAR